MSYCVNCGVELDGSARECPLCNTPVINPNEIRREHIATPFPKEKAQVETIERADFGWLVSMVALATAVTCGMLNWLVFRGTLWSLAVIGACVTFWVFMIPAVIYHKWSPFLYILLDGATLVLYLYLIARMTGSYGWLSGLGIPIVLWVTAVVEVFAFAVVKFSKSFLTKALYFFTSLGVLCVGLELAIDDYAEISRTLTWSAVVLTVCVIVDIAIITTLSRRKLRNELKRRLHF